MDEHGHGLMWLGFWFFMAVLVFSMSRCAMEGVKADAPTPYHDCIQHCPMTQWSNQYTSMDCPKICNELVIREHPLCAALPVTIKLKNESDQQPSNYAFTQVPAGGNDTHG
jgi:hypothetical protein